MINMEETINSYKETLVNVEVMMRRMLQPSKDKSVESSTFTNQQLDLEATGLFIGKGLKLDVPISNGIEVEDWVFKIKDFFFHIYGVPVEQGIKILSFHMEGPAYAGTSGL